MRQLWIVAISILFSLSHTGVAASQPVDCGSVLEGAENVSISNSDEQYIQKLLKLTQSSKIGSAQEASNLAASLGLSLPVEGIPVDFSSSFDQGNYGSKTWGEAFSDYLSSNTESRLRLYQEI